MPAAPRGILFGLPIGNNSGWGVWALNVSLQMLRRGIYPIPVYAGIWDGLTEKDRAALSGLDLLRRQHEEALAKAPGGVLKANMDGIVGLGNNLVTLAPLKISPRRTFGMVFFEMALFTPQAISLGRQYARIITGSQWNAQVLRACGLQNAVCIPQAVDAELFHPRPKSGRYANRFVVYSGGKLEYRKGQDLVVAVMREFERRHPEALLMFAWQNYLPELMADISTAGWTQGVPNVVDGVADFASWLRLNGVNQFVDLGPLFNWQLPELLRDADVAIFPNRCEGGTNQVAMECMAGGVPVILSANTGHLDLIHEDRCYALRDQKPVRPGKAYPVTQLWGESSTAEMLEALEAVWSNRDEARRRAAISVKFMEKLNWSTHVDRLLAEMGNE